MLCACAGTVAPLLLLVTRWLMRSCGRCCRRVHKGPVVAGSSGPVLVSAPERSVQIEVLAMSQLVECVPNFSEGKNQEPAPSSFSFFQTGRLSCGGRACVQVIDAISGAIAQTPGCVLLDVDAGPSTNRTVYTFVGPPACVVEGALSAARTASRLIDMSRHRGEAPGPPAAAASRAVGAEPCPGVLGGAGGPGPRLGVWGPAGLALALLGGPRGVGVMAPRLRGCALGTRPPPRLGWGGATPGKVCGPLRLPTCQGGREPIREQARQGEGCPEADLPAAKHLGGRAGSWVWTRGRWPGAGPGLLLRGQGLTVTPGGGRMRAYLKAARPGQWRQSGGRRPRGALHHSPVQPPQGTQPVRRMPGKRSVDSRLRGVSTPGQGLPEGRASQPLEREHPRMGALDVCPFIPVRGVSMDECVLCAQTFGQRLAEELAVPVYLYGEAARMDSRRTLSAIRAGEYEALPKKLEQAEWAPDFGPSSFVPSWGATVTGARKFLIAFNINLLSTKEQAHRIALNLREQGRGKDQPGLLKKVQGIGWYLDEKNLAQVSTNLLDFEVTALHTVYEETCREARELSLPVVGSQLVGLVPLKALLDAAAFYCKKENLFILEEAQRIRLVGWAAQKGACGEGSGILSTVIPGHLGSKCSPPGRVCASARGHCATGPPKPAFGLEPWNRTGVSSVSALFQVVTRLGLNSLSPFNPKERIIEYLVPDSGPERGLGDKSLRAFVDEVGARSAAPGGGSVAAAAAAMGAALGSMVGLMTYGRRQFQPLDATMRRLIPPFREAAARLTALVDADAEAFAACLEAMRLPKNTPEEKDRRTAALQEGLRRAVSVPLMLAETVASLWPALQELAQCGNLACRSDLQVAAKALEMGVFGAYFNVLINLRDVTDEAFKGQVSRRQAWCPGPTWGPGFTASGGLPTAVGSGGPRLLPASRAKTGTPNPSFRVCQIRHRVSSLLQEAKTQAALVLDCLEARRE
ncbi:Formimidoyltransferase-cyclodeaminase [Plecturocebus cupreus]